MFIEASDILHIQSCLYMYILSFPVLFLVYGFSVGFSFLYFIFLLLSFQIFIKLFLKQNNIKIYRTYLINPPGRLLLFWTLRVGAYSRWMLIQGWELIKFSTFSASVVRLFCNKTINGKNKTQRFNKARVL